MRIHIRIFSLILSMALIVSVKAEEAPITLNYSDLVLRISERNFTVLENSLKVYQAKESITVARGNLLPKLNLWKLIGVAFDPKSIIGVVEDIAPFLVPANWFRVEENKILFDSEKEGFRALWANELYTAKNLYVQAYYDGLTAEALSFNVSRHLQVEQILRARELMGAVPAGSTSVVRLKRLALESDLQDLKNLYQQEVRSLTFAAGMNAEAVVALSPLKRPGSDLHSIEYNDFWVTVQGKSPELKQFDKLITVIPLIKKEVLFSFLGASSAGRGVAGGVFDNLPVQTGLGFGNSAAVRIISKQADILKLQRLGIEETLKRNLYWVADTANSFVANYSKLVERQKLSQDLWNAQIIRMTMGEEIDFSVLLASLDQELGASLTLFQNESRYLVNIDRLDRLSLNGDYSKAPTALDELQGQTQHRRGKFCRIFRKCTQENLDER